MENKYWKYQSRAERRVYIFICLFVYTNGACGGNWPECQLLTYHLTIRVQTNTKCQCETGKDENEQAKVGSAAHARKHMHANTNIP